MPFKMRKSLKVAPGVKVNISKSGMSTSVGGKGYTANVGKKGAKQTVSAPGTGMSYSTKGSSCLLLLVVAGSLIIGLVQLL